MWWCYYSRTKMYSVLCLLVLTTWSVRSDSNIGCLFSQELCEEEEECYDDNAFGRCERIYGPDSDPYRHLLGSDTTKLLERELARLFAGGYRWSHEYTQCVVQNILYANRHSVTYDPGLCARVMQLTMPPVPPDLFSDLESTDPDEMAFIKFKPNRANHENEMYADEIFSPPVVSELPKKINEKRSPSDETGRDGTFQRKKYPEEFSESSVATASYGDRDSLFRQLMEAAQDTEQLFRMYGDRVNRFPGNELPVIQTDLSSDLDQRPIFSEGGVEWLPVRDDSDTDSPLIDDFVFRKRDDFEAEEQEVNDTAPGPHEAYDPLVVATAEEMQDEPEQAFRFNYRPRKDMMADDLSKWAYAKEKEDRELDRELTDGNAKHNKDESDLVEEDYLEDQLYAILPIADEMPTFNRPMRHDIKKPGPNYAYRETDDGDTSMEPRKMAEQDDILLTHLMEASMHNQLHGVLRQPVDEPKASARYSPREEVIEEERWYKETILPPYFPTKIHSAPSDEHQGSQKTTKGKGDEDSEDDKKRNFERLNTNQPELLEGTNDQDTKFLRDEDRTANAGRTGEGHIGRFDSVDATHAYLLLKEQTATMKDAEKLVRKLEKLLNLSRGVFADVRVDGNQITFKVNENTHGLNASDVAAKAETLAPELKDGAGLTVESAGIGDKVKYELVKDNDRKLFILTFALCGGVAGILVALAAAYLVRRHARSRDKLHNISQPETEASQDYQDLCRQRMCSKASEKPEAVHSPKRIRSLSQGEGQASSSSHSSTSSWNEEPVTSNMDISTGHMILSYMEDHLKNKDRLDREWEALCAYEAELCSTTTSSLPQNIKKNRYTGVLPYDHSRVTLNELSNVSGSDFINASSITDHDPRNPAYIATQGPLPHTAADFWQMIWEQGSVVIVMLSRLMENGVAMCHRYWPEEGSEVYHIYEVHLVSEHIWCDDYLVRSFYLKNLRTSETRTVTQFHFLSWPDNGVPNSTKALLEFRRKVNKSYRGRSCPIVVHCSDGIGRTGTYCLIDMVLNRMAKGAKEIDIAATLEHVRDQRGGMVKTKAQFEFVLMAIAEEVHAILKALSQ